MKGKLLKINQRFVMFSPLTSFCQSPSVTTPSFHHLVQNDLVLVKENISKIGEQFFVVYCKLGVGLVNKNNSYEVVV